MLRARPTRLALGGMLAALALMPATALANPLFGMNDTSVTGGQENAVQSAAIQSQLGATSSRATLNWAWVQPTSGPFNFGTFDAIYTADLARGIRPLFVLTGAPSWAWGQGTVCLPLTNCNYPPGVNHNADWQNFVAAAARRYPQAAGFEIWNEPNQSWAWAGGIDPARYTQLLKLAYGTIKSIDPSVPVAGGALATDMSSTATPSSMPLSEFLQSMYNNGARGSMDGLSIHPYPGDMDWWYAYKAISMTTEVRDANGDSVPLWITETGATNQQFSATQQAEIDANLVQPLMAYPGVAAVYINTLAERTVSPQGYGILTSSLQPLPAFCSIASVFNTSYVCPSSVQQATASATQLSRWQAENLLQLAANAAISSYAANGSYTGLTSAGLNAIDSRVSATAAPGSAMPGAGEDPSQIGVYPINASTVLLCNTSQADLSYCIYAAHLSAWAYGDAAGSIFSAAYNVMHGISKTWDPPSGSGTPNGTLTLLRPKRA